jgi:hypothetical protein
LGIKGKDLGMRGFLFWMIFLIGGVRV